MVDLAAQALRHNRLLEAMPLNTLALLASDLRKVSLEACACECYQVMHDKKFPHALGVKL